MVIALGPVVILLVLVDPAVELDLVIVYLVV